jgi:sortase A
MTDQQDPNDLSIEDLEQLLYSKKRAYRRKRLLRLRAEGRMVNPKVDAPAKSDDHQVVATRYSGNGMPDFFGAFTDEVLIEKDLEEDYPKKEPLIMWRWVANRFLLIVEIVTVVGLIGLVFLLWQTTRELNRDLAEVQQAQSLSVALPTPTSTPVIGVAVLPSGHKPPVNGRPPEPGEAGEIPAHLLPIIDAYVPPPIPTPGPAQARRIQIPAINIDKPIVQGDDWEQLKKGVGQHVGSTLPGEEGNLVLSAHNDIYGEIFRNLDKLEPGDEIIVSTDRQDYAYVVRDVQVVDPTDVWVMSATDHASTTLISCYPYLVNNKRIVIFADLAWTNLQPDTSS